MYCITYFSAFWKWGCLRRLHLGKNWSLKKLCFEKVQLENALPNMHTFLSQLYILLYCAVTFRHFFVEFLCMNPFLYFHLIVYLFFQMAIYGTFELSPIASSLSFSITLPLISDLSNYSNAHLYYEYKFLFQMWHHCPFFLHEIWDQIYNKKEKNQDIKKSFKFKIWFCAWGIYGAFIMGGRWEHINTPS